MALEGAREPSGYPLHILQLSAKSYLMGIATGPRRPRRGNRIGDRHRRTFPSGPRKLNLKKTTV
jgi:hypothetical protein